MKRKTLVLLVLSCITLVFLLAYPSPFPGKSGQRKSTVFGSWNGYNNHLLVLECINRTSRDISMTMQLKNFSDEIIGEEDLQIKGNGVSHTILNKFDVRDSYGTIALNTLETSFGTTASCFTVTYRLTDTQEVEYASSIPLGATIRGKSSGVFNSMNPDIHTNNRQPVLNWLTLYNPDQKPFSATILVRDQSGNLIPEKTIALENLESGGRRDFALGHTDGEIVGIYQIIPSDSSQIYGSFLSRYSSKNNNEYNFSIVIPSSGGSRDSGMISASTMGPAYNWAEIVNIYDQPAEIQFEVFDRTGGLLFSRDLTLQAFAQHHEFLNQFIGELNVGYFRVRSSLPVISQSFFYGIESSHDNSVNWAYSVMGGKGFYQNEASYPVNTNLGAPNWFKVFADDEKKPLTLKMSLYNSRGETIDLGSSSSIVVHGSADIAIHEFTGEDFTGSLHVKSESLGRKFNAQVLRVLMNPNQKGERSKDSFAKSTMRELSEDNTKNGRRGTGLISYFLSMALLSNNTDYQDDETDDKEDSEGEIDQDQFDEPITGDPASTPHEEDCNELTESQKSNLDNILSGLDHNSHEARERAKFRLEQFLDGLLGLDPCENPNAECTLDSIFNYLRSQTPNLQQRFSLNYIESDYRTKCELDICKEDNSGAYCGCERTCVDTSVNHFFGPTGITEFGCDNMPPRAGCTYKKVYYR
jgi:hypothetical protein